MARINFTEISIPGSAQKHGWRRSPQDLGKNTLFSLGYRRHTDLYVLLRDNPAYYTNRHEDDTWDAALRRHDFLRPSNNRQSVGVFYGAELLADHVASNNLGVHSRKQALCTEAST